MRLLVTIPGEPMTKQRPRVTRHGVAYTPGKTVAYETLIKELFAVSYPNHVPVEGPLALTVRAYFGVPRSWSKTKQQAALMGHTRPTSRKDWDNIGKIVSDALNGIAYRDDGQVVDGRCQKHYSDRPRVEIEITEVE